MSKEILCLSEEQIRESSDNFLKSYRGGKGVQCSICGKPVFTDKQPLNELRDKVRSHWRQLLGWLFTNNAEDLCDECIKQIAYDLLKDTHHCIIAEERTLNKLKPQ